jgi:hypothetical protein
MTTTSTDLEPYAVLIGTWDVEFTHPMMDGPVRGETTVEWLTERAFLIQRTRNDHPQVPDSIQVIGPGPDGLQSDYYDQRGVRRVYAIALHDRELRQWRAAPGFSQRFAGTLSADGTRLDGLWQMCTDDATWFDDPTVRWSRRA